MFLQTTADFTRMPTVRLPAPLVAVAAGLIVATVAQTSQAAPTEQPREVARTTTAVTKRPAPPPRFTFRITGRGYGHGVGMSQYGAYGAALAGMTAEAILALYYPGTTLAQLPPTTVRVELVARATVVGLASPGTWALDGDPATGRVQPLPVATPLSVRGERGGIVVTQADGTAIMRRPGPVLLTPAPGGAVTLDGVAYRGALRVVPVGAGVRVVNVVGLEDYLQGVVAREMPASWGARAPAALQAQAIAARSYAVATRRSGDFDMYADERSQVYGGVAAEDPRTNAAVQATAGRVVTHQGQVATTFFFSTSGGRTENAEHVFGNPVPYLVSVDDARFDRLSPRFIWRGSDVQTFTEARLGRLLGTKPVVNMRIVRRGVSGRAVTVRVTSRGGGVKQMSGADVRRALGLSSSWFGVVRTVRR